ncbi:hypothetical protein [Methanobrevibacter sp.]|uniref:hypothetical protein n=1 Tax=Methanobrevibacter sp. TaxID=66852 RepID=UPI00386EBE03
MKVFSFAGIIFNADNVCTIQKINMKKSEKEDTIVPGLQIVTVAGEVNFSFENEEERDKKFDEFLHNLEKL